MTRAVVPGLAVAVLMSATRSRMAAAVAASGWAGSTVTTAVRLSGRTEPCGLTCHAVVTAPVGLSVAPSSPAAASAASSGGRASSLSDGCQVQGKAERLVIVSFTGPARPRQGEKLAVPQLRRLRAVPLRRLAQLTSTLIGRVRACAQLADTSAFPVVAAAAKPSAAWRSCPGSAARRASTSVVSQPSSLTAQPGPGAGTGGCASEGLALGSIAGGRR